MVEYKLAESAPVPVTVSAVHIPSWLFRFELERLERLV
jgi:hypothetical protein